MAKESALKESPVMDALKKLKEEEVELMAKLKPVQEAIAALEKIVEKSARKTKQSGAKDISSDAQSDEEVVEDAAVEA